MHLAYTSEQLQLGDMVRAVLVRRSTETDVRRLMATETGIDLDLWHEFARLGLLGLGVPEKFGGSGCGAVEVAVVMEELGRALSCVPYLSSVVLAATTLLGTGDDAACGDLLPRLIAGETRGTVALPADGSSVATSTAVTGTHTDDGVILHGVAPFVVDGASSDFVIVPARINSDVVLCIVATSARGVRVEPLRVLDPTRRQARLTFDGVPAHTLQTTESALDILERVQDTAAAQLAMEQVGGAAKALEMTVEYAKLRVQFGRVIGSFQAIKHRCADLLVLVESARAAAMGAVCAAGDNDPEAATLSNVAGAFCAETFTHTAAEMIQLHGGIGYTWEHSAHLYFRRAKASELLFGDAAHHRASLAHRLGL